MLDRAGQMQLPGITLILHIAQADSKVTIELSSDDCDREYQTAVHAAQWIWSRRIDRA